MSGKDDQQYYTTEEMIHDSERIAIKRAAESKGEAPLPDRVADIAEAANTGSTWSESHSALSGKIFRRLADTMKEHGADVRFVNNDELTALTETQMHTIEITANKGNYYARVLEGTDIRFEGSVNSRKDVIDLLIKFR